MAKPDPTVRRTFDRSISIELFASWIAEERTPARREPDILPEDLLTNRPPFTECITGTTLLYRVVDGRVLT